MRYNLKEPQRVVAFYPTHTLWKAMYSPNFSTEKMCSSSYTAEYLGSAFSCATAAIPSRLCCCRRQGGVRGNMKQEEGQGAMIVLLFLNTTVESAGNQHSYVHACAYRC